VGESLNAPPGDPGASGAEPSPELSIVIPVYNEKAILVRSVRELCVRLDALSLSYEILLAENGSRDGTPVEAATLAEERPEIRTFSYPEPNYGGALREAIYRARGRFVVCEEIDLCDVDFHVRALGPLRAGIADMVIGSKAMRGANDTRPLPRRVATRVYNAVLRVTLGFRGTDTHGLKAFAREAVVPVVASCVVEHDVFASELVIRAQRMGLRVVEIPVEVREKRAPSVRLARRVPRVLGNLARLMLSIHGRSSAPPPSPIEPEPRATSVSGSGPND
jgi:glycosyltransferase involved in cell wall biosynthesis